MLEKINSFSHCISYKFLSLAGPCAEYLLIFTVSTVVTPDLILSSRILHSRLSYHTSLSIDSPARISRMSNKIMLDFHLLHLTFVSESLFMFTSLPLAVSAKCALPFPKVKTVFFSQPLLSLPWLCHINHFFAFVLYPLSPSPLPSFSAYEREQVVSIFKKKKVNRSILSLSSSKSRHFILAALRSS